ncbi:hypothetical protein [Sporolactobacillus inulinus]|uniref:Cation diffusion facilitator family transporter n=1 Tax=Sporolactobacillus inulinus CASD TaxID=1069536 RepID=A0A0U1QRZ2_9BACL|nr:hypothetical protein [Sporolactobacillus inulinus]KLI03446.1 hypothetical protein SINU_02890 [Sporolactobacillus inulinus CASD]GEB77185.1 hypothetical protein SIN01_15300 [Sporolactobacillus inulinus]
MISNTANQNIELDKIEADFDFEEIEGSLSKRLEESFSDLNLLEADREKISDPDSLGKTVLDEIWKQFGNQIGLDMTNESLIQKYDREHPEPYKDNIDKKVMQDKRYIEANKTMKEQQQAGKLKDAYTGRDLKSGEKANLDHVVSKKELYDNQRRKQANLSVADLANKQENLKPTNESLNKSKGAKSIKKYVETRETREKTLITQNERASKKVMESNKSETEKRWQIEKNNKLLNDKLAADDDLMMKADKEARKAINRDIHINAAKEVGKKVGKDTLKTMAISALFTLLKEIINGLVRFIKTKAKSFNGFLTEMRESVKSFFSKILSVVQNGVSTLIGTILSEIFGPIVSAFKKLSSLIKQGVSSVIDAVNFLQSNKNKPLAVKVAQVGKIITAGLVGGSAIFLGEVFEKFLLSVPGMQIQIPMIGTLANMIGLFLSSLVSGLIGSIILNIIDKFIAKKLKEESDRKIIDKKNETMNLQQAQRFIAENHVVATKDNAMREIAENHTLAKELIQQSLAEIFDDSKTESKQNADTISENQRDLAQMQKDLEDLI